MVKIAPHSFIYPPHTHTNMIRNVLYGKCKDMRLYENRKQQKAKKKKTNKSCFIPLCVFGIQFACIDEDKAYIDVDYMNPNTSVCLLKGSIK